MEGLAFITVMAVEIAAVKRTMLFNYTNDALI